MVQHEQGISPSSASAGPSELDAVIAGVLVVDPLVGVVKADIGIKDGRIVGYRRGRQPGHQRRRRPGHRPAHAAGHGLRPDRDGGRRRHPRPPDHPGAPAGRALAGADDADHRGLRGAAVGDGADAAGLRGWPLNVGLQASARAEGPGPGAPRWPARGRRRRLQDPRGLRRVPGADRRGAHATPTVTTCRSRCTPTG